MQNNSPMDHNVVPKDIWEQQGNNNMYFYNFLFSKEPFFPVTYHPRAARFYRWKKHVTMMKKLRKLLKSENQ